MVSPNRTASANCYVPILKSKQGELGALEWTDGPARSLLLPLVELSEVSRAQTVANSWGNDEAILIQPLNVGGEDEKSFNEWVKEVFGVFRSETVAAVPVVSVEDDRSTLQEIGRVVAQDQRGMGIRVDADEIALATQAVVASALEGIFEVVAVGPEDTDLVLDCGLVRESVVSRVASAEAALSVLPWRDRWRNLVVAFSAFPEGLGDVAAKGATTPIARDDALAFTAMLGRFPKRVPVYGDYGIGTPFYNDIPWAPIPAIRYTDADQWQIVRGTSRHDRNAQYVALAAEVCGSAYFSGPGFSPGDQYLADVASGSGGPGNPMTYVRAGTSRHLAVVLDRLASLGVP